MTTNNHPANGPVSLERLHQIRETLSKAAAQSDGGNLGYAMADAVKVIDGVIATTNIEPVACIDRANLDYLADGCDGHVWATSYAETGDVLLYTTPITPAVPDEKRDDDGSVTSDFDHGWNACRATMLQAGNSPVTPDGWIPVSEKMPPNKPGSYEYIVFDSLNNRAHHDYWNVPDGSCDDFSPFWNHYGKYVTHWMPLPAAPQQEVKRG
ncbi:DUF551 domain-containing protein [Citrobacter freundii]|uniref:DUF551 domain-containing protein n=1 Tax=Citrobacter freundii TaxID=546 RepID=UPI003C70551E